MKLSRNVLVGSLATVGMVLGAVAPAVTAQAAKTSGVVNSDGTVSKTTDASGMEDAGQLGKGNLAIAYSDKTTGGSAEAYSNAAVQVVSGVLVLDKVPDFNFGAAASGSVKGLQDNSKVNNDASAVDGNDEGTLQVIESREKTPGFTLTAALGQFKDANGTAVTGTGDKPDFILNLAAAPLQLNGEDLKNGNIDITTQAAEMKATDNAATGAQPIMTMEDGKYEAGTYSTQFNNADMAKLTVASGIGDGSNPSVKALHSTITWNLTANPTPDASTQG